MCGIAGVLSAFAPSAEQLQAMADALKHRGPDSAGTWVDPRGIGFAHARLSILDLSAAGHQPMLSRSSRFAITFNGEIYNHMELRARLLRDGVTGEWRGHSDTETLLAGFEAWGIERTLRESVGMFAMAVWDRSTGDLVLARDRMGEKPLYFGWQGGTFLFGSDLAALRTHPAFEGEIDRDSLASFMRHNYVPGPESIYRGISKLPAGMSVSVSLRDPEPRFRTFWSVDQAIRDGLAQPFAGDPEAAVEALEVLLRDSVKGQMLSDVPLGAFLSGGVDSSLIVAMMSQCSAVPVHTFTIGFHEADFDEAPFARAIAAHLSTNHTEVYVSAADAWAVIPQLPMLYTEPFADVSQIPTFLVSRIARGSVTVCLSGDGGDELFGGYTRYDQTRAYWQQLSRWPSALRGAAAAVVERLPVSTWTAALRVLAPLLRNQGRHLTGDRIAKGAALMGARDVSDLYQSLISVWQRPELLVRGTQGRASRLQAELRRLEHLPLQQRLMAVDQVTYLPDDIMVKVDRASMGCSLETRAPLLDHRVVELAWRMAALPRVHRDGPKWPLRQLLRRWVPDALIDRPKQGFAVPIGAWLRGPLRDWAEALLAPENLEHDGHLDAGLVRRTWAQHLSGKRNWHYQMWCVLMFLAWRSASRGAPR